MNFNFTTIPKIYFGNRRIEILPEIIKNYGKKLLIVTGSSFIRKTDKLDFLTKTISAKNIESHILIVKGEPSPSTIDDAVIKYKNTDVVVAIGGGSVIDTGKAISAMLPQNQNVINFLEGIGDEKHNGIKIPFIALPTTSGTGSEATKNAVLSIIGQKGFKKSLRHDNFVPNIAIIDPELTSSCPFEVTVNCGMDTFAQLLGSYVSTQANPMTDALALDGITRFCNNFDKVCTDPDNIETRAELAYASLLSGITLANAGLGIVHGFASSIGGFFDIPHGVICGSLLAAATEINILELRKSCNSSAALKKYAKVGQILDPGADSTESKYNTLINTLYNWSEKYKIPSLKEFGIKHNDFFRIIKNTGQKNNPVNLNDEQLEKILRK